MALIAVLWMVAAMTLIVTGIVHAVRSEARIIGLQRQSAISRPIADAAILLAMQNMHANKVELPKGILTIPVQFENQTFNVSIRPANGLMDLNTASIELLTDLYRYAGEIDANDALQLAQATLEFRQTTGAKGIAIGFDSVEDLLNVPTMTYALYAKIKNLVTADIRGGSGRINPMACTSDVMQILTHGDGARAGALVAQREANNGIMDTSFLNPSQIEVSSSSNLQFQVQVDISMATSLQKTVTVYWATDPRSGLPWRILDSQESLLLAVHSTN
jgi:general secretion pathway protein K